MDRSIKKSAEAKYAQKAWGKGKEEMCGIGCLLCSAQPCPSLSGFLLAQNNWHVMSSSQQIGQEVRGQSLATGYSGWLRAVSASISALVSHGKRALQWSIPASQLAGLSFHLVRWLGLPWSPGVDQMKEKRERENVSEYAKYQGGCERGYMTVWMWEISVLCKCAACPM